MPEKPEYYKILLDAVIDALCFLHEGDAGCAELALTAGRLRAEQVYKMMLENN